MTWIRSFSLVLAGLVSVAVEADAQVTQGGDATGLDTFDFEDVSNPVDPWTPYSHLCGPGITVGERLVGQTLGAIGPFDVVSGTPSTPLAIDVTVPAAFGVSVHDDEAIGSRVAFGEGGDGWPAMTSGGEGAVSLLFDVDQFVVGLSILGTEDEDKLRARFYDRAGGLVSILVVDYPVVAPRMKHPVVFTSTVGIAAITLNTTDAHGLGYDDVRYTSGVPPSWEDLGQGLAGTHGTPSLEGTGIPCAGSDVSLVLGGGLPGASALLVIGTRELGLPWKGGTLVPSVDVLVPGLPVDASGALLLGGSWSPGIPAGTEFLFQVWIADPGGPAGAAASNALKATAS